MSADLLVQTATAWLRRGLNDKVASCDAPVDIKKQALSTGGTLTQILFISEKAYEHN